MRIFPASLLALATTLVLAGSTQAQAPSQIMIGYDAGSPPITLNFIALRPNIAQPLAFFYKHSDEGLKRNVKITLQDRDAQGKYRDIAQATIAEAKPNEPAPIDFAALVVPAKTDKGETPWPQLPGPPFQVRFKIEEGKNQAAREVDVPIVFREPRNYVSIVETDYDPALRKLSLKVQMKDPQGPPCRVELDMERSVIPGLKPTQAGTFVRTLSAENPVVDLTAEKLEFDGDVPPPSGRIYLTVDGYKRAFLFKCTFSKGSLETLADSIRARMVANRYSLPGPTTPVLIEADSKNVAQQGEDLQNAMVELTVDRVGNGNFENVPLSPFRGLRELAIGWKTEEGKLVLKTRVADRQVLLNTEGINGKRTIAVRVLSGKGAPLPLADEQDARIERIALFDEGPANASAPLRFLRDQNKVLADIVLDSTPPEGLKFVNLVRQIAPEKELIPGLQITPRTPDQAPIDKVTFYYGKFAEGKIPPTATPIESIYDLKRRLYVAKDKIVVPADQRGKIDIAARAVTLLGKATDIIETIEIVVPPPPTLPGTGDKKDKLATITGTVRRGSFIVPGVDVFLVKVKATKEDTPEKVKANDNGKYTFKEVEPGKYVIVSRRSDMTVGRTEIVVKKNENYEKIDVELKVK
jgi:hypothetical protein